MPRCLLRRDARIEWPAGFDHPSSPNRQLRQALAIDSTLAAPYATLGYVALYHHWDWKAGEQYCQWSIALDPSYSTAHQSMVCEPSRCDGTFFGGRA